MTTQASPVKPPTPIVKRRTGLSPIFYGRILIDQPRKPGAAPVQPDVGPAKLAVLTYRERIVPVAKVLEFLERAHRDSMIGATVRCVGSQMPCAVVEKWDWDQLIEIAKRVDSWERPAMQGYETVKAKGIN